MKIARFLPDTDLARFALLSRDNKKEELRNFSLGAPRHSWAPFRAALPAIHNARKSLFGLPPCSWADVEDAIKRGCKAHPEWLEANIELAKLFHDYNQKLNLIAVEQEFYKVPIGFGAYMKLWNDFYTIEDDVPVVSFIDPRRRYGLNELGRKFVFSAMYHNLAIGDFEEA